MEYQEKSLVELKQLAKERGLKGVSTLKKADLIARLQESEPKPKKVVKPEPVKEKSSAFEAKPRGKHTTVSEQATALRRQNGVEMTSTAKRPNSVGRAPVSKRQSEYPTASKRPMNTERSTTQRYTSSNQGRQTTYVHRTQQQRPVASGAPNGVGAGTQNTDVTRSSNYNSGSNNTAANTMQDLDSGKTAYGILEVMSDGFGFIRSENYLPGEHDIYVSPAMIRRFGLRTGDMIKGSIKVQTPTEKFSALLNLKEVNGFTPEEAQKRIKFEHLTPIFPNERIHLENEHCHDIPVRITDLLAPVGKGQRGMIVSPPKAGKTTLLKQIAKSVSHNYPDMVLIVLLIDERPEEVTDIRESIEGDNVEVIYSTFDELPDHHKRVSEMVLERAKRLVEHGRDVMILLDSITRLARAYNLTVAPSGRTLSGGLDPAALYSPKKFFGAARNMRDGGSLTILATALVDTGSRMDDVVFEEFKGTGNMELVLDRGLSEKRIFPAIDVNRSGTRRDDLLLNADEQLANRLMHREMNSGKMEETIEEILRLFTRTKNNAEFVDFIIKTLGNRSK